MEANTKASGTFSFTLAAEWDYVPHKKINRYINNNYSISIDKRLNMREAVRLLLSDGKWKPYGAVTDIGTQGLFPIPEGNTKTKAPLYNEYLYFNSHMRRMVYNQTQYDVASDKEKNTTGDAASGVESFAKKVTASIADKYAKIVTAYGIKKYAERVAQNGDAVVVLKWQPCIDHKYAYYLYRYMGDKKVREYKLPISSMELRLYSIGVVLLTIRCQDENANIYHSYQQRDFSIVNPQQKGNTTSWRRISTAEDLSWVENCGRRVFASRSTGESGDVGFFNDFPVFSMISPILEERIVHLNDLRNCKDKIIICDFLSMIYESLKISDNPPEYLTFISSLLPHCVSKMQLKSDRPKPRGDLLVLDSYNDDRMYLHGTVISEKIDEATKCGWRNRKTPEDAFEDLAPWYGIIYSDSHWDATCQDKHMLVEAVENATDARWLSYGTFYGMTYHSMVLLIGALTDGNRFLIANHDWIYLQMFLIAVLQRCAIQRFYREASGLLQIHTHHDDVLRNAVQDKYTLFLNQFWFYEITEQEQGKMMFTKLQGAMNVKGDVEFLDRALDELHQQAENRMSNMVNKLLVPMSILGGFWAFTEMVKTLIGAFGIEVFSPALKPADWGEVVAAIILLIIIAIPFGVYVVNQFRCIKHFFKHRRYHKNKKGKK